MDIQDLEKILSIAGNFSLGFILGGLTLWLILRYWASSYLSEKGKNLATKEDVGYITDKVESVRNEYAKAIELLRSDNQLRLAAIEREKSIKKDVFLSAVTSINRCHGILSRLTDLNVTQQEVTGGMSDDVGSIARLQVVGTEATVKSVTELMAEIGTAVIGLMMERGSLLNRLALIRVIEEQRSAAGKEIDRHIAMMKEMNLHGNYDQRLWDVINGNIDFEQNRVKKCAAEAEALWKLQTAEHLEFTKKCMSAFFRTSRLIPEVVLSIRSELDLAISKEAYLEIYNSGIDKGVDVFNRLISRLTEQERA